jgi:hypothetical protein
VEEFIKKLASLITEDPDMPSDDPLDIRGRVAKLGGKPHYVGPDSNIEREIVEDVEDAFWRNASIAWTVMDGGGRDHNVDADIESKTLTVSKMDGTPLITYKVNVSVVPVDKGPEGPVDEGY